MCVLAAILGGNEFEKHPVELYTKRLEFLGPSADHIMDHMTRFASWKSLLPAVWGRGMVWGKDLVVFVYLHSTSSTEAVTA